jgi:predicted site-specific integrase-resolvase
MQSTDTYSGSEKVTLDPDQMLTRKEAAALISYSYSTIKRWQREGILTAHRGPDDAPRYRRADVLALLERKP